MIDGGNPITAEGIKKYIFDILEESGIYFDSGEVEEDVDLREYLVDSLQYIYLIVELEERLGVELPDEVIIYDNFISINGFANMVVKAFGNADNLPVPDFADIKNDDELC